MIKALADEGHFKRGVYLLTGSDTLILKEAAMRFPGRRVVASKIDFHLYPLSFREFVDLVLPDKTPDEEDFQLLFSKYLKSGGYLKAINDIADKGAIATSTFLTYEQWIRGDFLKKSKSEENLLQILRGLLMVGVSQISYSALAQKIDLLTKVTIIDYIHLLQRMNLLIGLQAYDPSKKQGFPRKGRKFHFMDSFICETIFRWLKREGYLASMDHFDKSALVEGLIASHCRRFGKTYYFKDQGEIDVIWLNGKAVKAIEVKWSNQVMLNELKMLREFKQSYILGKSFSEGKIDHIHHTSVVKFLFDLV